MIEIRDNRQKEWFWLDNEYLNGYAKHLGVMCTAVYISLCRHVDNKTQSCFPSMRMIAEENGISDDTVMRAIKKLELWGIISVTRAKKSDGTQANNLYVLTAKSMWKEKPTRTERYGTDPQKQAKPTRNEGQNRPAQLGHNNTQYNNTHINNSEEKSSQDNKEIVDMIEAFKDINANYRSFFKNTTERAACREIIKTFDAQDIKQMLELAPKYNKLPFIKASQKIYKPTELLRNWSIMRDNLISYKQSKQKTVDIIS